MNAFYQNPVNSHLLSTHDMNINVHDKNPMFFFSPHTFIQSYHGIALLPREVHDPQIQLILVLPQHRGRCRQCMLVDLLDAILHVTADGSHPHVVACLVVDRLLGH